MRLLYTLIILITLPVYGQSDLSGIYTLRDSYDEKIVIVGNKLYYIDNRLPLKWFNDTLAQCTIRWIDKNFIELNSFETSEMQVIQKQDSRLSCTKIAFHSPYNLGELDITICTDESQHSFRFSQKSRECFLPMFIKSVKFIINSPKKVEHKPEGITYGRLFYKSPTFKISEGMNLLSVKMPMIDNSFFDRYYIRGNYALVKRRKIIWKGKVYIKQRSR